MRCMLQLVEEVTQDRAELASRNVALRQELYEIKRDYNTQTYASAEHACQANAGKQELCGIKGDYNLHTYASIEHACQANAGKQNLNGTSQYCPQLFITESEWNKSVLSTTELNSTG
eukprot:gene20017-26734_t